MKMLKRITKLDIRKSKYWKPISNLKLRKDILKQQKPKLQEITQDSHEKIRDISEFFPYDHLRKCFNSWMKKNFALLKASQLIEAIHSKDKQLQHYGIIGLRKLLSRLISIQISLLS